MKNIEELKKILENLELQVQKCLMLLSDDGSLSGFPVDLREKAEELGEMSESEEERVIEGVFDGQKMIGPDGKQYSIPANYISKSKLVEGDILKLTIDRGGNFVYKQIGPVERERLIGTLLKDEKNGEYVVLAGGHNYKIILASVTYFKGDLGDEVVILTPKNTACQWAAVETIIKKR